MSVQGVSERLTISVRALVNVTRESFLIRLLQGTRLGARDVTAMSANAKLKSS